MTPDERTALNEAVCKRLGWVLRPDGVWVVDNSVAAWSIGAPDFTSDWNAVYRWIVPAVKEMDDDTFLDMELAVVVAVGTRHPDRSLRWWLYATPEDYCRAFLAVTEVGDAR